MKRLLLRIGILLSLLPVTAMALPAEITDALPEEAQELVEQWEDTCDDSQSLWRQGIQMVAEKVPEELMSQSRAALHSMALLLVTVLLCSLAEACYEGADISRAALYIPIAGTLAVTAVTAGNMETMIGLGEETIGQLNVLSDTVLPALSAAVAASGGMVSASVRQIATVAFSSLLMTLLHRVLLPLVNFYMMAAAADAMLPSRRLKAIADSIRKGMSWTLCSVLALFTAYLRIFGAVATATDSLTLRITRSAIGTAVPVVGSIISDAADSVLGGAVLLKNTVGVAGMVGVLVICVVPFATMALQYLLYKVTAFAASVMGQTISGYIDALGNAFGLILGMTGCCCLLLLLSISSSISVVVN